MAAHSASILCSFSATSSSASALGPPAGSGLVRGHSRNDHSASLAEYTSSYPADRESAFSFGPLSSRTSARGAGENAAHRLRRATEGGNNGSTHRRLSSVATNVTNAPEDDDDEQGSSGGADRAGTGVHVRKKRK